MAGLRRNLIANVYSTTAVVVGQIALVPLFLSSWGQIYYGQWLVLSAVPAYLALSDVGISNALGNQFSICVERGEHVHAQDLMGAVWRFQTWFSLALTLLVGLAVATFPVQSWLKCTAVGHGEFRTVLLLLTVYSLLPLQIGTFSGIYRAAHAFPKYLLLQGHMRILELFGTTILLCSKAPMLWLAALLVVLRIIWLCIVNIQARRLLPDLALNWGAGTWTNFSSLLPIGAGFFAFPIGNALINQGMTLAVNNAGGPGAVVTLSVCRQVGRIYLQISSILFTSLHPELTTAYAQLARGRMQSLQAGAFLLSLWVGTLFSIGAFVLGGVVVQIWTGMGSIAGTLVGVFAIEAVTAALGNLALVVPWATSRLGSLPFVYLIAQLMSLIVSWTAFPYLGIGAVGVAFLLGNLAFTVIALSRSFDELECSLRDFMDSGQRSLRDTAAALYSRFS